MSPDGLSMTAENNRCKRATILNKKILTAAKIYDVDKSNGFALFRIECNSKTKEKEEVGRGHEPATKGEVGATP